MIPSHLIRLSRTTLVVAAFLFVVALPLGFAAGQADATCSICKWRGIDYSEGARLSHSCNNTTRNCQVSACRRGAWQTETLPCTIGMNCPPVAP